MEANVKKRQLNYEVLRIICMVGIVFGHISGYINIGISGSSYDEGNIIIALLKTFFTPMVNSFVLISGYFLITAKFKIERFVKIYLETIFYLMIATLIMWGLNKASIIDLFKAFFFIIPSKASGLWFIRMYLALLMVQPFLSIFANNATKKQYSLLLVVLLFLNTHIVSNFPLGNVYLSQFSNFWFITVFLIGGYIRLYVNIAALDTRKLFYWFIGLGAFIFYVRLFKVELFQLYHNSTVSIAFSTILFLLFSKWNIRNNSFISFISSSVFAIYILHEMPFVKRELPSIINCYIPHHNGQNDPDLILYGFTWTIIIFVCGIFLDKIRICLFDKVDFDRIVVERINKIIYGK